MKRQRLLIVLAACLAIPFGLGRSAVAQTAVSDQDSKAEKPDSTTAKDVQAKDAKPEDPTEKFRGDLWTRKKLTGDWGGARTDLFNHGIDIDLRLTQYFQGVAKGGRNTNFAYGGKLDIFLNLDGHKAGLWEGFYLNVHAESKFGNSILSDAGSLALANTTMLYPKPADSYRDMAVTQVLAQQLLSKNLALAFGKINVIDLWTMIYPETGGGVVDS